MGSPIMSEDDTVVGLASLFGAEYDYDYDEGFSGCCNGDFPDFILNLGYYDDWIKQAICCLSENPPGDCGDAACPSDPIMCVCLPCDPENNIFGCPEDLTIECPEGQSVYDLTEVPSDELTEVPSDEETMISSGVNTEEQKRRELGKQVKKRFFCPVEPTTQEPSLEGTEMSVEPTTQEPSLEGTEMSVEPTTQEPSPEGTEMPCFSSHASVLVEGKGYVPMNLIEVGDKVLSGSGEFKETYAIDHRHLTKPTTFVQIHSVGQAEPLELTPAHMLFKTGDLSPVPTFSIKVGDEIRTLNGSRVVTDIKSIVRKGLFNPLVEGGTVVVSGIVSSTYSSFISPSGWIEINGIQLISYQGFFNAVLKPYQFICTTVSIDLCKTDNERIMISDVALKVYHFLYSLSTWLQVLYGSLMIVASFVIILSIGLIDVGKSKLSPKV